MLFSLNTGTALLAGSLRGFLMPREVTERDFRMPEFRDAKPEDYEFRADGQLVRKDRWMTAVGRIRGLMGFDARSFEIADVIDAVERLSETYAGWRAPGEAADEAPDDDLCVDVLLLDGSVLADVKCGRAANGTPTWSWRGVDHSAGVVGWHYRKRPQH